MSDVSEKPVAATDDYDDDDWRPVSVPVEEDPYFTPERLERLKQRIAKQDPRRAVELTFKQVHALINIFEE